MVGVIPDGRVAWRVDGERHTGWNDGVEASPVHEGTLRWRLRRPRRVVRSFGVTVGAEEGDAAGVGMTMVVALFAGGLTVSPEVLWDTSGAGAVTTRVARRSPVGRRRRTASIYAGATLKSSDLEQEVDDVSLSAGTSIPLGSRVRLEMRGTMDEPTSARREVEGSLQVRASW